MAKIVNATVKMIEDLMVVGYADSGHAIVIDASPEAKASGPMELVLIALGSCTSMDVITILKKKREDLRGLTVELTGERAPEDPMVYTDIRIHYTLEGKDLSEEAVRKTIALSQEKYCSVLAMLSKTAKVEYDWKIVPVD
jgi:putative redox protein